MPYATTTDKVRLYYEEVGSGTPILFSHEFAGDHRNWEPQMRFFARRHRCITYSCRGYKPSDIPADPKAYSYQHWIGDVVAILDHLKIDKVHFVGLSQGGFTALMMGINHPSRLLSLTAAGAGSGSQKGKLDEFRATFRKTADEFEKFGSEHVVNKTYGLSPQRIAYLVKDPRGFSEFNEMFASHDPKGAANVLRGFQAGRPSLYEFEEQIKKITVPSLIVVGDEDDACLEPSFYFKKWISPSGLVVLPKTGHVVNQEEPALFNDAVADFVARVEAGRWPSRDPRSVQK